MRFRRWVTYYDATIFSLLTISLGLWFIMTVDLTKTAYIDMVDHVTGVYLWINGKLFLSSQISETDFLIAKVYWGGSAIFLGFLDFIGIVLLRPKYRRVVKAFLFAYWIQIFFFLGVGNFYTTAFPMYAFVCVMYAVLYLRLSDDD